MLVASPSPFTIASTSSPFTICTSGAGSTVAPLKGRRWRRCNIISGSRSRSTKSRTPSIGAVLSFTGVSGASTLSAVLTPRRSGRRPRSSSRELFREHSARRIPLHSGKYFFGSPSATCAVVRLGEALTRQSEFDARALAELALDADLASVRLYDALRDGEAETGTLLVRSSRLPVAIEDFGQMIFGNSATRIGD